MVSIAATALGDMLFGILNDVTVVWFPMCSAARKKTPGIGMLPFWRYSRPMLTPWLRCSTLDAPDDRFFHRRHTGRARYALPRPSLKRIKEALSRMIACGMELLPLHDSIKTTREAEPAPGNLRVWNRFCKIEYDLALLFGQQAPTCQQVLLLLRQLYDVISLEEELR